jgi:hypothetical protein
MTLTGQLEGKKWKVMVMGFVVWRFKWQEIMSKQVNSSGELTMVVRIEINLHYSLKPESSWL